MNWQDIECPLCLASEGSSCISVRTPGLLGQHLAQPHEMRVRAAAARPTLDEQMQKVIQSQCDHIAASHAQDRTGWTRQQWISDADDLMHDIHGSVLDLVNGHVMALLAEAREYRDLRAAFKHPEDSELINQTKDAASFGYTERAVINEFLRIFYAAELAEDDHDA